MQIFIRSTDKFKLDKNITNEKPTLSLMNIAHRSFVLFFLYLRKHGRITHGKRDEYLIS